MKVLGIGSMVECGPQSEVSIGLFSTGNLETHPHLPVKESLYPIYMVFVRTVALGQILSNLVSVFVTIRLRARARALHAREETTIKYRRFPLWVTGPAT